MIDRQFINRQIGWRVKQERHARGWTIRELGNRSGLSNAFICQIENAKSATSAATLFALAQAFDLPIGNFFEAASYSYGHCPHCGAAGVLRERRPDGNDTCEQGHVYPSAAAVKAKGKACTS
jgi:transcriptional regulator with XRE-family HTH domain